MNDAFKRLVKSAFRCVGLEVTRCSASDGASEPPPLIDDPLDALHRHQAGSPAAFPCPLDRTRSRLGFSYGADGWHPYVETLREYETGRCTSYAGSLLRDYYRQHSPSTAAEAIPGFEAAPAAFHDLPPHLCYLSPWTADSPDTVDRKVRNWIRERNREHNRPEWYLESDGVLLHGPVSDRKGRAEYEHLVSLYEAVKRSGFDRTHGDVQCMIVRRGGEFQFLQWGEGSHRTAVMAALGRSTVPAVFRRPRRIIDLDLVEHWPQVQCGVWDLRSAAAYVEHLFSFDARAWAQREGLTADLNEDRAEPMLRS